MPLDPSQDQDFLKAPRDQQIQYLRSFDPDFAKASPSDQRAYLDHVTRTAPAPDSAAPSTGDPRPFGPHQSTTSPLSHFLPDINQRVASTLRPVGHPMESLRGVDQSVKDYQAQRDPNEGNWFTRGLGVLGKGIADTASDYWEHPGHLVGDITTGVMTGLATSDPAVRPVQTEVGATNGIPWGTGGKGPLSQRGRMIPPAEPVSGTYSKTIPVRPSATAPTYEAPLPGVNVRPSVERLYEPSSALQRASEPPAPANPSAVQVKPSVGRISEFSARPVEPSAESPIKRASESQGPTAAPAPVWPKGYEASPRTLSSAGGGGANYSAEDLAALKQRHGISAGEATIARPAAPGGVRPVEVGPNRPSMIDHWLGEHSGNFDPSNPRHAEVLSMRNEEMAAEANRIRFEGKSDWKGSDLARSDKVHGKGNWSPIKQRLANALMNQGAGEPASEFEIRAPYSAEAPARPKGVRSMLPTPEEEARIRKSMVSREAAKKDLESGR